MTIEQISNLTISNMIYNVLDRLLDLDIVPDSEEVLTLNEDESLSYYDRLNLHVNLVKPLEADMLSELELIKAELIVIEEERLAELARIEDIKSRYSAMTNIREVVTVSNPALELIRIIEENDQEELVRLETAYSTYITKLESTEYINKRIAEYPSERELIVAMWENDTDKLAELESLRQAIKTKYPKP